MIIIDVDHEEYIRSQGVLLQLGGGEICAAGFGLREGQVVDKIAVGVAGDDGKLVVLVRTS